MQELQVQSLDQEDPLEMEMATHSNIFAWEIPWTEEPGGLQSVGSWKSQTQLSNQTTTMPTSVQRIPSWENPKVGIFMVFRSDSTMGRLLFAKIYPKLQERQRANWLIYSKKPSQAEQNAAVIRTARAFPLDTIWESKRQGQTSV